MLIPWIYLTISKETIKEIGTKLVNNKIQLPHFIKSWWKKFIYTAKVTSIFYVDITERKALNNVIDIWARKINATIMPILNSSLDFFWRVLLLFNMILVSTPVYTTTPVTHSVILRLHPLSTTLLLSSGTPFQDPVKVWIKGLGLSYLNYYLEANKAFS